MENQSGMFYKAKDSMTRIKNQIAAKATSNTDGFDLNMVVNPEYKKTQKLKWKSRNGFTVKQASSACAWKQVDNAPKAGAHPYFDGHSKIGQLGIERQRVPLKEKAIPFSPA